MSVGDVKWRCIVRGFKWAEEWGIFYSLESLNSAPSIFLALKAEPLYRNCFVSKNFLASTTDAKNIKGKLEKQAAAATCHSKFNMIIHYQAVERITNETTEYAQATKTIERGRGRAFKIVAGKLKNRLQHQPQILPQDFLLWNSLSLVCTHQTELVYFEFIFQPIIENVPRKTSLKKRRKLFLESSQQRVGKIKISLAKLLLIELKRCCWEKWIVEVASFMTPRHAACPNHWH